MRCDPPKHIPKHPHQGDAEKNGNYRDHPWAEGACAPPRDERKEHRKRPTRVDEDDPKQGVSEASRIDKGGEADKGGHKGRPSD
jgi:hypothetical protein